MIHTNYNPDVPFTAKALPISTRNGGFENLNHQSNLNQQSETNNQPAVLPEVLEVLPEVLEGSGEKMDS